jgi:phenylacetate-coenzyme A ligase PaaK-like adenylate-forming protein
VTTRPQAGSLNLYESIAFRLADLVLLGSEFRNAYTDLTRSQWLTSKERHERTETQLARLREHAATNVPFYRGVYHALGMEPSNLGSHPCRL